MKKLSAVKSLKILTLFTFFTLFLFTLFPVNTVLAATTNSYPELRNAEFANVWIDKIFGGRGHVGVNVVMDGYNPCQNNQDPYYGSCIMSKDGPSSYYKLFEYYENGSNNFPYGMFIDNTNSNYCVLNQPWCNKTATSFNHKWANRITFADVEIYPHDNTGIYNPMTAQYGGARIIFDIFGYSANKGLYSVHAGNITLPSVNDPSFSKLNGFVLDGNNRAGNGRLGVDAFQEIAGYENGRKLGALVTGFSSGPSNGDGFYTTGPLYQGNYKIYFTDNNTGKKIIIHADIFRQYERIDIHLDQNCFGFSTCEKVN